MGKDKEKDKKKKKEDKGRRKKETKKDKKKKKTCKQVPLMFPPHMWPGHPTPASSGSTSSSTDSGSSSSSHAKDQKQLKKGATELQDLPKSRLQDILAAIDSSFDNILTAECSEKVLLMVIYILTRTRPMTHVKHFRARNYEQLNEKFETRAMSIARFDGDSIYAARKDAIRMLEQSAVDRVAGECQWDDSWLIKAGKKRGGKAPGGGEDQKRQATLPPPPQKPTAPAKVSYPPYCPCDNAGHPLLSLCVCVCVC